MEDDLLNFPPNPFPIVTGTSFVFGREVVANVKWFDKSTCRGLLYFFMFRYEIGSYRKGRG